MKPEWFLEQIDWLAQNNFHTLNADELVAYLDGKARPPLRSVILRFDAGLPDMSEYHSVVMPALRKYGFHAFMFVLVHAVSDQCEQKGKPVLCWEQLRKWEEEGLITVGSHGMYHPDYTEIPTASAKWDASESKKIIERKLGHEIYFFTYPFDAVPKSIGFVESLGYKAAFAGHRPERSLLFMDPDRYAIPSYYPYSVPDRYPELTTATNAAGKLATFSELMLEAISPAVQAVVPTAIPMESRSAYLDSLFSYCSYYRTFVQAGDADYRERLYDYTFPTDITNATRMLLPSVRVTPTCNFTVGNIPVAIVLHYTQGELKSSLSEFLTGSNKSIHYLVDRDGSVVQMVPEQWAAHHLGCTDSIESCQPACPICQIGDRFVAPWNRAIGIEIVNDGTLVLRDGQYYTRSGQKYTGEVYEYTGSMHGIYHYRYWAAFPPEQLAALELLIEDIRSRYTDIRVLGHSDIDFKVDPGPALEEFMKKYQLP